VRKEFVEGELSREIIGAFYEVYNALGPGFVESVYSRALEIALTERGMHVEREFTVQVSFAAGKLACTASTCSSSAASWSRTKQRVAWPTRT